jgi:hypothetical protein
MKKIFIGALALTVMLSLSACRSDAPTPEQNSAATAEGTCPKLEGAFFGVDKATIKKGEAVTLRYRVPHEYAFTMKIEGVEYPPPSEIASFTAEPSNSPLATPRATAPPTWYNGTIENVRPEKTKTYILKVPGREGCQSLELPATVKVE